MTEDDLKALLKNNPAIKVQGSYSVNGSRLPAETVKTPKPSKYRNKKCKVDGVCFDSEKESRYFKILQVYLIAKEILGFVLQPKFLLQEGNEEQDPIHYIADFIVFQNDGTAEIWDVKASETYKTDVYKIKKKMFMARYPRLKIIEKY